MTDRYVGGSGEERIKEGWEASGEREEWRRGGGGLIPTKKSVFGYGSRCSFVTWIESVTVVCKEAISVDGQDCSLGRATTSVQRPTDCR